MAWRALERLIGLSRDRADEDGGENAATVSELPEDESSAAVRSRQVFRELAKVPVAGGEPELNVSRMEEAMNKCGLDGEACSRMYAVSKWAKTSGALAVLDLAEFQLVVERFSGPARLQRRLRRRVDEYMAERGLRFVYAVDGFQLTDAPGTSRRTEREAELRDWDEVLDGLADLSE